MIRCLVGSTLLLIASAAPASTPAAWNQMNIRVNRACVTMSGLSRPILLAKRISFSDEIGTEVRMLRGTDSKGRTKRLLCAYDRRTRSTEVQDADAWNGPTTTP